MKFLSLQPFVPSGNNFEDSKLFFVELGFNVNWDAGDYIGFERDGCKFILQKFDNKEFAENFMITVGISNADEFWKEVNDKINLDINPRLSKEAFSIIPLLNNINITGGDERGLIYGCYSLANDIRNGIPLKNCKAKNEKPFLPFRAIKFDLPWDTYRHSY